MTRQPHKAGHGFSLFEFGVAVSIFAILATAFLCRVIFYLDQAERVHVEQMVALLRTAMHLKIGNLMVKNQTREILLLEGQNPMDWLGEQPKNYVGEYYAPKATDIATGNWYFDRKEKKLVYLWSRAVWKNERAQARFAVKLTSNVADPQVAGGNVDRVTEGVILEQLDQ